MATMQKLFTTLWFDNQAEDAVRFYTAIFKNSEIGAITHYGKEGFEIHGRPEGSVMTIGFRLEGVQFSALNGGPHFKFNEAVSFSVNCDTQEELDYYWEKLSQDGDEKAQVCGWLKDKFGVSWQIVPSVLPQLLGSEHKEKSGRVMKSLMQMKKLDIATLEQAFAGEEAISDL